MIDLARLVLDELAGDPAKLERLADLLADRIATRARPEPTSPALLTVPDAARLLGCSPRTVRRRIAEHALPAVVEHGRVMLRSDELLSYIERLDAETPARRKRTPPARGYSFLLDD